MNTNHDHAFRPELLAGYADGELNAADCSAVDAWLSAHPETRTELDAQLLFARKNTAFWQKAGATQPNDVQWNGVFGKICNATQPNRPAYHVPVASNWRRWAIGISAIAVATLFALNLNIEPRRDPVAGPPSAPSEDVALAIASADDVDIISIQGDGSMVVIGEPPLGGSLEMTTLGDVIIEAIFSDADGQRTKLTISPTDPKKPFFINPNDKTHPVP